MALEINSDYADAYNNRGVIKKILNDHYGALKDYSSAIEYLNNSNSFNYVEKSRTGLCYNGYLKTNSNLIYNNIKIQLIGCIFGDPKMITSSFDFSNLRIA